MLSDEQNRFISDIVYDLDHKKSNKGNRAVGLHVDFAAIDDNKGARHTDSQAYCRKSGDKNSEVSVVYCGYKVL